jgi:hypothetical protein
MLYEMALNALKSARHERDTVPVIKKADVWVDKPTAKRIRAPKPKHKRPPKEWVKKGQPVRRKKKSV